MGETEISALERRGKGFRCDVFDPPPVPPPPLPPSPNLPNGSLVHLPVIDRSVSERR